MPHKKNPDVFEIIRAKSKIFFTYSLELKNITFSLTSGYSRDLQETKYLVMDALEEAHEIIDVFRVAIGGIEFDSEKVFKVMDSSIFSVDVAVEVMKKYGISFRDAYRVVGEIIIELTNTSTDELLKKYESMPLEREIIEWFSKDTKELFYYFISKRTQEGYPKL
jgi:argininosuccinate lyase